MGQDNSNDLPSEGSEEVLTEEMLWERIPQVQGVERANTYYELSARVYARGQYEEALALAESAKDLYIESAENSEGLAQAYSAMGYNLNQLKRIDEAATAMGKAVEILRASKSALALELSNTLGEWLFSSKEYKKTISCMDDCLQEYLVEGDTVGSANSLYLIGLSHLELKEYESSLDAIRKASEFYKEEKNVVDLGRCYHKIARINNETQKYSEALTAAQKALDIFLTARDQNRQIFARWELSKAQMQLEKPLDAFANLELILDILIDEDPKDFSFIVEVEDRMAQILRIVEREPEALEIEARLATIKEILKD